MCVRPPHAPLASQRYRSRMFGWVCDCWLMIYTPCSSVRMFRSNISPLEGWGCPFSWKYSIPLLFYVLWTSRLLLVWELVKFLQQFSSFDWASLYSRFSQYHIKFIYKHRQMLRFVDMRWRNWNFQLFRITDLEVFNTNELPSY